MKMKVPGKRVISVAITPETHRELRIEAIRRSMTFAAIVDAAMKMKLEELRNENRNNEISR